MCIISYLIFILTRFFNEYSYVWSILSNYLSTFKMFAITKLKLLFLIHRIKLKLINATCFCSIPYVFIFQVSMYNLLTTKVVICCRNAQNNFYGFMAYVHFQYTTNWLVFAKF